MITHSDTYALYISNDFDATGEVEYYSLVAKYYPSTSDSASTAALLKQTVLASNQVVKYVSLLSNQALQVRLTPFPNDGTGMPDMTKMNVRIYSMSAGTASDPPKLAGINYASFATIAYDSMTSLYSVITQ